MICDVHKRNDEMMWFASILGMALCAFIFSGSLNGASLLRGASESILPSNPVVSAPPSVAPNQNVRPQNPTMTTTDEGGDQLPVVVDPESPGSCALVANSETCGSCCSDVFNENTSRFDTCMYACDKAASIYREH
jgi:hypothetical protein